MDWDALEEWLLVRGGARSGGWAPSTVDQRVGDLRRLERLGLDVDELTINGGDRVLAKLLRSGTTNSGYNNYVIALNGLARYHDLDHAWDMRKPEKIQKRWLQDDEIRRLLGYRHHDADVNRLHRAVLLFALKTALRPSEAFEVRLEDLDDRDKALMVHRVSKFGIRRRIPVEPWMFSPTRPFGAYLRWRRDIELADDDDWLWVTTQPSHGLPTPRRPSYAYFRDLINRIGKDVDVDANWRKTRRTRADELLEAGWDVTYVSRYLGHRQLDTTLEYLQISDSRMLTQMADVPGRDLFQL